MSGKQEKKTIIAVRSQSNLNMKIIH